MNFTVQLFSDSTLKYVPQSQDFDGWKLSYKKSIQPGAEIGQIEVRGKIFLLLFCLNNKYYF